MFTGRGSAVETRLELPAASINAVGELRRRRRLLRRKWTWQGAAVLATPSFPRCSLRSYRSCGCALAWALQLGRWGDPVRVGRRVVRRWRLLGRGGGGRRRGPYDPCGGVKEKPRLGGGAVDVRPSEARTYATAVGGGAEAVVGDGGGGDASDATNEDLGSALGDSGFTPEMVTPSPPAKVTRLFAGGGVDDDHHEGGADFAVTADGGR
jgi:hypothetical protein